MRAARNRTMERARKKRLALAQLNGIPTSMVPAAPIRARLHALTDLGWSLDAIAAMHGAGTSAALRLIANGNSRQANRKFEGVAHLPITLAVPDSVPDNSWVPALGATRRIQALLRLGWRHEDIEAFADRSVHVFAGAAAPHRTRAIDWRIIDATYEALSATLGGSIKTATRAERLGYFSSMAWSDIDDPHERPSRAADGKRHRDEVDHVRIDRRLAGDATIRLTRDEIREAVRRLHAWGLSAAQIAERAGVTDRTVTRLRGELGLSERQEEAS